MSNVPMTRLSSNKILVEQTSTGDGSRFDIEYQNATFQCIANGTSGAFSATVYVQVSNDGTNWENAITFILSGTATTADSEGGNISAPWRYVRGYVNAISGTGAFVDMYMGV